MDEKVMENKGEMEIDFRRLLNVLLGKAWLIAIVAVVVAVAVFWARCFL